MLQRIWMSAGLFATVIILSGCVNRYTTQMPSLNLFNSRSPEVEKRSYDLHDPYPDETIGPETITRPRAFQHQRTNERRSFEQKALQGKGVPTGTATPQMPTSQYQYPGAIRE